MNRNQGQQYLVSLFHFNVHWGGDGLASSHKHIAETLVPFITWLSEDASRRCTLEMSATSILFVEQYYKQTLTTIQKLIFCGQVELLCGQYAPSIWPAFPAEDLVLSFRFAQDCLARLGLPKTRGFFSQEAFFGLGLESLRDEVDYIIVKDDGLEYCLGGDAVRTMCPVFLMKGIPVVVSSGHLLKECCDQSGERLAGARSLFSQHLEKARQHNSRKSFAGRDGHFANGDGWRWLHCGDGNHWAGRFAPTDLARCRFEPEWSQLCNDIIESYMLNGFRMITVSELYDRAVLLLGERAISQSKTIVESGWNPEHGHGMLRWMGAQAKPWEDCNGILTAACRARARVACWTRQALADGNISTEERKALRKSWETVLCCEISDWLGWSPSALSVFNGRVLSEQLAVQSTQQMLQFGRKHLPNDAIAQYLTSLNRCTEIHDTDLRFGLIGKSTNIEVVQYSDSARLLNVEVNHSDDEAGICFDCDPDYVGYCRSGCEDRCEPIPPPGSEWNLPAANGLVRLTACDFVIKWTSTVHVAARVNRNHTEVSFKISGPPSEMTSHWCLLLLRCSEDLALATANEWNSCGMPQGWIDRLLGPTTYEGS